MEDEKVCRKCGRSLPLSSFYENKAMKDGHLNICKDCHKEICNDMKKMKKEGKIKVSLKEIHEPETPRKDLSEYTPRELMQELSKRGYRGKLEYTETHIIDITNF